MVDNLKLLILGGDIRQLEVAKTVASRGTEVLLVGFEQFSDNQINHMKSRIQKIDFSKIDALLLPVSGMNNGGKVEVSYSNEEIVLTKEDLLKTPEHCVIYTGIITPYLNQLSEAAIRKLVPLFARDDIAILNSIPTAEGTLQIAIENTDNMIHGSKVMILGYGRVGKTMARVFSTMGAHVRVGSRNEAELARAMEAGLTPFHFKNIEMEIVVDICINTIPHLILTSSVLSKMSLHTLIIDVASKPGGTDFQFAEKRGIKLIWALGIPGKIAPKSAGEIIDKVLAELLENDFN
ncbi:dipicolinate synthase subunit DpsA [Bacillus sp. B15-48]|uniref:dipicolinate synthase subunit DpsA n=1 Tax=Bacillus sp. B15-48 TaxID=1548601 RepID=UPI001940110A|nr:dipicolinate synthase subunit DpsA [Bacillus sp. B15-48]MBM4764796.1 dipicolinate synthase subunit DpsA [Bacillus sp. B15-48]